MVKNEIKTVRLGGKDPKIYEDLMKIQGYLQAIEGKYISMEKVLRTIVDNYNKKRNSRK